MCPCTLFWGEGSPGKIDYRKNCALLLTSLLEDLVVSFSRVFCGQPGGWANNFAAAQLQIARGSPRIGTDRAELPIQFAHVWPL